MQKVMIALVVAVLAAGPLVASENTDVMATVNKMVDDFNKGDTNGVLAACTDEMSIIDEFPPHEWGMGRARSRNGSRTTTPTPRTTESPMASSASVSPCTWMSPATAPTLSFPRNTRISGTGNR
jgi:hypothetical protein